jgi:hypothetical protein
MVAPGRYFSAAGRRIPGVTGPLNRAISRQRSIPPMAGLFATALV